MAASMDFFWPVAKTFAKMVSEGAGACGARLRCGAAGGLARPGQTWPEKDAGHASSRPRHSSSPIARFLCSSLSAAMAFNSFNCWGGSRTPSASKVVDAICGDLGSGGTREPTIIASAGCCGSILATAIHPAFVWGQLTVPG